MGQHVDKMEVLLREAFPGMLEEFYEYGKWCGGAFNSAAFEDLPFEKQIAIEKFLRQLGLFF